MKDLGEILILASIPFIYVYFIMSILFLASGSLSAPCEKHRNYETVFPAYKLGCWLASEKVK